MNSGIPKNCSQTGSGMADADWWGVVAPVLEQVMVGEDLALSARVGGAEHALAFGLDTILDGVEARIR